MFIFVSPELSLERDYVITHSVLVFFLQNWSLYPHTLMYSHGTWTQWSLGRVTRDLNRRGVKGHLGANDPSPLVQVFQKRVTIHILWWIFMGLGYNDPWVESHIWLQKTWGQRSSRGQWPLVQVFEKRVTVSTYFDVFSWDLVTMILW